MKKILERALEWFMSTRAWEWLSGKFMNHLIFRFWGYPKFKLDPGVFDVQSALLKWMDEGNVGAFAFVCTDRASLTARLIRSLTRGRYSHAGVLLPGDGTFNSMRALHIIADGLQHEHPMNVFCEADDVAVVAFPMDEQGAHCWESRARNFLAMKDLLKYDFEQRLGADQKKVYCSELVLLSIQGLTTAPLVPTEVMDRPVFTPDDVAKSGTVIFERRGK